MRKNAALIFVLSFLFIIFTVPFTQAVMEFKKDGKIQVLELISDVTTVPVARQKKINTLLENASRASSVLIKQYSKGAGIDSDTSGTNVNDTLHTMINYFQELNVTCNKINHYVNASPELECFKRIDKITKTLKDIEQNSQNTNFYKTHIVNLEEIQKDIKALKKEFPIPTLMNIPVLVSKNLSELFWDSRYIRPYEKKIENNSVYAQSMRPFMNLLRYYLFNDLGEKGVYGKNGYFFYRPDVQYTYKPYINESRNYANKFSNVVDPELLKENEFPIKKIVEFRDQLNKRGIDLLVTIIPGKPSIYTDKLSFIDTKNYISPSIQFIKELRSEGVEVVDLFAPFVKEKENDSITGESLYLQKDTHWKVRGAWCAATEIAKRVKQYNWYTDGTNEYVIDTVEAERDGDIAHMSTLPNIQINELTCKFPSEKTRCFQVSSVLKDSSGNIVEKKLYKDEYKNSKILLLGDSFSRIYQTDEPRAAGWISHIAYMLKQPLATIVNDGGASTIVREVLARKNYLLQGKKLVIWEFVERDIRYGENGWKSVSLNDMTNKE